jgi:lipopolysaccharide export system ATP-binding protein
MAILEFTPLPPRERAARVEEALEELNIRRLARSQAYTLSGGERRRVEIARAMVLSPTFFLLDEPFAGIDPIAVSDIQGIILHLKERGIGVVVSDHNVRETLKITDEAYIISDGAIFRQGSPAELARDPDVRRVYLGEGFTLD